MKRSAAISTALVLAAWLATVATVTAVPPAPPRWVTAVHIGAQNQVALRWLAVPGATAYHVLRSEKGVAEPEERAAVSLPQYFDAGVEPGKTYVYRIRAEYPGGELVSETTEVRIPAATGMPLSPPQWEKKLLLKGDRLLLQWKDVPGAIAYNVYRSEEVSGKDRLLGSVQENRYVDQGVEAHRIYYYTLGALDSAFKEVLGEQRTVEVDPSNPDLVIEPGGTEFGKSRELFPAAEARSASGTSPRNEHTGGRPCTDCHIPHKASGGAGVARPGAPQARRPSYPGFGQVYDEVWVISRGEAPAEPSPDGDVPGSGELRAILPGKEEKAREIPLPLTHTEVRADVFGYLATTLVAQRYDNPYAETIEAVYVFPLPENAAVSDFVMVIGERRIRGIIRERQEAEKIYRAARDQGYVASLLTQERPNIFTQKVANIEPGREIDVEITYFNTLAYQDGSYVISFPMVVGPRYNPPGSREGVGAVARTAVGSSGQPVEVPYLKPGERSGHDIMITVNLDAGIPIEAVESPSHAVEIERTGLTTSRVRLRPADTIPNRDFVLRWKVAGKEIRSSLMTERNEEGGFFTLMLQPPGNLEDVPVTRMELVLVLDTSGSMSGWPIERSKAAAARALKLLGSADTFQIVRFSGNASRFAETPLPATPENLGRGLAYVESLAGSGGTEMLKGISASLDFPHDPKRLRIVAFMTDGFIGNEQQILHAVAETLGPSRIFSFGVGTSVNRHLIEGLARLGKGAVAYLLDGQSDTRPVDLFFERVRHAALTDMTVDWGSMRVSDVYPPTVPDLFVGRPVILTGRFAGRGNAEIRLSGLTAGEPQTTGVRVSLDAPEGRRKGIARIWARARIAELSDRMVRENVDLGEEIRKTALAHGLISDFTAFVAVDSSQVTEREHGVTVHVPVPVPEGVRYETTVPEK